MDPTREERIRAIFEEALDAPREGRERVLARHCRHDEELRREVESLLRHVESMGSFLATDLDGGESAGDTLSVRARQGRFLRPGDVVGECVIEELLDRGSSSEVYRARLGAKRCAIKVVPVDAIGAGERARFEEGARIAARIRHPHLAEVYDHGLAPIGGGLLYFTMRLVEGPTLQEVLSTLAERGVHPEREDRRQLVRRTAEIAEALDALHQRRIVHRDVKPANVVLEGGACDGRFTGSAQLVDFGLLRRFDHPTIHSTIWATPAYAAPELLVEGRADARTDVHALGLCLADLLVAKLPLDGRTLRSSHEPLRRWLPSIERGLEAIVDRACDPLPERRYPDGGALARDLGAWLEGERLAVRPLTRLVLARRWTNRNPATVLAWLSRSGAALLTVLALAFLLARGLGVADAARDARAAWSAGELVRSERAAREVPAPLRELLLPTELARTTPSAGVTDPLTAVLHAMRSEGTQEGTLLAARHLELDGVEAHPAFVLCLDAALRAGLPSEAGRASAARVLARLFFDRYLVTPGEVAAAASVRERLLATLLDSRGEPEEIFLVCALGGCGEASALEELLEWACTRFENGRAEDRALHLQSFRSLELLVRRSHACGFRAQIAAWDWNAWLEQCGQSSLRGYEGPPSTTHLALAFEDLCIAVAAARRAEGLPALDLELLTRYLWRDLLVVAAGGTDGSERAFERECLLADPLHHEDPPTFFASLGRALGLRGDASLTEAILSSIESGALPAFLPVEDAGSLVRGGVLTGRSEAIGLREDWLPDPDTRLGSWFTARENARASFSSETYQGERALAWWRFSAGEPDMHGAAEGLGTRCTTFDEGEARHDHDGYARLAIPGISELDLRLRFTGREWRDPQLRISYQKAARWAFPYFGEAWIAIDLDGTPLIGAYRVQDEAAHAWSIPLAVGALEEDVEHVLTLRLLESSTTTFRVYWVEIDAP